MRRAGSIILTAILAALGIALVTGGAQLAWIGGSVYYLLAGLALLVCAWMLWKGHPLTLHLYAAILIATLAWSIFESGFHPWGLVSRLGLLTLLGLALLVYLPVTRGPNVLASARARFAIAAAVALVCLGLLAFATRETGISRAESGLISPTSRTQDWNVYGGNQQATKFSRHAQITPANVGELEEAWQYSSGDIAAGGDEPFDALGGLKGLYGISGLQATPLQVGNRLYTCTERNMAVALEADTGKEVWRFDPKPKTSVLTHSSCRGVAYHAQPQADPAHKCATRIFLGSLDSRLWAVDALDGKPCVSFGENGSVSLRAGLGNPTFGYHMTAPGTIVGNLIVVGAWIPDNQSLDSPSGVVRAYDVITGNLTWAWDMGQPERQGAPPAGEIYTPGTPNLWTFGSADNSLGLVYVPLGNPSPDLWGGARREFDDRYSSSLVALDAATGRPRWSFQTVHHDLWDYDLASQPVLYDIPFAEGSRPAVIQATKPGEIFVLDRRTGEPIHPVEERAVPQDAARGDRVSKTQPFSAISVRPADLREEHMWGITPIDQMWCRLHFRQARYEGIYTPPGERPTINHPGSFGSVSWGGVAIDEARNVLVTNKTSVAYYMQLIPRAEAPESARRRRDPTSYQWLPMEETPFVARIRTFLSPLRIPCNQPPWGHMEAFDLSSGRSLWKRTLGTARDSGPFGWPTGLPLQIGTPMQGGAIATISGLTFIAATTDNYLRAIETTTGRELWRGRLPAGGQATPMTYVSPRSGRQYVVVAGGGHAGMRTRRGDYVVAFALRKPQLRASHY